MINKEKSKEINTASNSDTTIRLGQDLAIGVMIKSWPSKEMWPIFQNLAKDVDLFAQELHNGGDQSARVMMFAANGYFKIMMGCKDPDATFDNLLPTLKYYQSNLNDLPGINECDSLELYVQVNEGEPVYVVDLIDDREDCICDDCIKAMNEEQGKQG